ncbi:M23 family metallopeptidase [Bartonella ancashensis]|uniref:Lipoprotein NlpD n=1 Tax=Bartonella ancashensis TaxID=1318743 RepID=A0A0M4L8U4_9HYPH|nr:M23 family metallopeptidase [Bartonella ancashensis]ALE03950.1 Lipoprotein NlpD [Bartonella ancashensis]
MSLKDLDKIFRCSLQKIVSWAVMAFVVVAAGCSFNTERFSDGFYENEVHSQPSKKAAIIRDYYGAETGGVIESSELPPLESLDDSRDHNNGSYNFLREQEERSPNESKFFADGRIVGKPPRNLGTLPRSIENSSPVFQKGSYIVQSGDTLSSIAQQMGVSIEALKLANGIKGDSISIGKILIIPENRVVVAKIKNSAQDTKISPSPQSEKIPLADNKKKSSKSPVVVEKNVSSIANMPTSQQKSSTTESSVASSRLVASSPKTVTDSNDAAIPQTTGISKMRWPVRGRLLSQFGQKKGIAVNKGIDISVPEGTSVKAVENGIVIYASDGLKELGNVVMIRHEDNIITIYGHNSQLVVNRGQRVRRGDEIAKSGISGSAQTPRVYFEIRKNSLPVNPTQYLEN